MKKFLIKIGLYLFIVIPFFIIQVIIDDGLKKCDDHDDFGDWNRIFSGKMDLDVAILGNSRAWVHINPDSIMNRTGLSTYNFGVDGAGLGLQRAKWASYIQNNPAPKYVIQSIDLVSSVDRQKLYGKGQYLPYLYHQSVYDNILPFDEWLRVERVIPLIKYRGYAQFATEGFNSFFLNKRRKGQRVHGFAGQNRSWDDYETVFRKQLQKDSITVPDSILTYGLKSLHQLIDECQQHQIHLILVHTPYYYELLKIIPQQEKFLAYLQELGNAPDIDFWDYSVMDSLSYSRENFYNATHLNAQGAAIFSDTLARRLELFATQP